MSLRTQPLTNYSHPVVSITASTREELQQGISRYPGWYVLHGEQFTNKLFNIVLEDELECWRCGCENAKFVKPSHPDGGGNICHNCWKGIYERETA